MQTFKRVTIGKRHARGHPCELPGVTRALRTFNVHSSCYLRAATFSVVFSRVYNSIRGPDDFDGELSPHGPTVEY